MGLLALALAMTPKIGPIGRLMAGPLSSLFPSRFPAADYKAAVAIAAVILAADSWRAVAARATPRLWAAIAGGVVLLVGAQLVPSTYGSPTRTFWLLAVVVVATVVLALARPKAWIFVGVLLVLISADGWRMARDDLLGGSTSSWLVTPRTANAAGSQTRDRYIRELPALLAATPEYRPARVPPAAPLKLFPQGTNNDSEGWIAEGYHLIDYGGTVEKSLHQVELSPTWTKLMLQRWHAFTFPCASVGCESGHVRLPSATGWRPSPAVQSVSYSGDGITYSVNVTKPTLMVENELAMEGWRASTPNVRLVTTGGPFRAWRLSPGRYRVHGDLSLSQRREAGAGGDRRIPAVPGLGGVAMEAPGRPVEASGQCCAAAGLTANVVKPRQSSPAGARSEHVRDDRERQDQRQQQQPRRTRAWCAVLVLREGQRQQQRQQLVAGDGLSRCPRPLTTTCSKPARSSSMRRLDGVKRQ